MATGGGGCDGEGRDGDGWTQVGKETTREEVEGGSRFPQMSLGKKISFYSRRSLTQIQQSKICPSNVIDDP